MIQAYSFDRTSVGTFLREVAVYSYGTESGSQQAQPTSIAANLFADKYDFASSAARTKLIARWNSRIAESNHWGTNAHVTVNKKHTLSCEVDYPANEPAGLAWAHAQLGADQSALKVSQSFYSEFVDNLSQLQTFENERDAIDANQDEPGGKVRRQPYLWGSTRQTFAWDQPSVRGKDLVTLLFTGWTYLISFEHRDDEPLVPESWASSKTAAVDINNKRQYRKVG